MFFMYTDRRHHNYLMLTLHKLKDSKATTLDTSNSTIFDAVEEARQMLEQNFSHLTGIERWYAKKDVELAQWAMSVPHQHSSDTSAQGPQIVVSDKGADPKPEIHRVSTKSAALGITEEDLAALMNGTAIEVRDWELDDSQQAATNRPLTDSAATPQRLEPLISDEEWRRIEMNSDNFGRGR